MSKTATQLTQLPVKLNITPTPEDIACALGKNNTVTDYKNLINSITEQLHALFLNSENIDQLISYRSQFFDALLVYLWQQTQWQNQQPSLIAVGGYGRGELLPHSDIDLLFLLAEPLNEQDQSQLELFVTSLWDLNITIGHSVRTVEECVEIAKEDITVITNLMESRLLHGDENLFEALQKKIDPQTIWSSKDFFYAKEQEQINRHKQFNNTEYNLEPNLKECPGGLRDIQMVNWVLSRENNSNSLQALVEQNYLTDTEFNTLIEGQQYLWKVRFALHSYYQREEDRLLFEAQKSIAQTLGFEDNDGKLAVEQFMQEYYRWALALASLNEMIMQLFTENILHKNMPLETQSIDEDFQIINAFIDIKDEDIFNNNPSALLKLFVIAAENTNIKGIRARTIRAIHHSLHLIDENFRSNPENHSLFLQILKSPQRVGIALKYMKRFGVLGAYIPAFEKIMGQTQHDLFHIYTVDAHTLLVAMNIRLFSKPKSREDWPVVHDVITGLDKIELLYLAAIFHDIAKGRGGDHSTLGAVDAFEFCRSQGLSRRDSNLVSWLVEKHLLMSSTAQRKDISDPEIIRDFALEMGDRVHLDFLYALTVADINATNKKLWNSWRASLLRQLYSSTKRALRRGLEHYLDREEWIADTQQASLTTLIEEGFSPEHVRRIWNEPNNDYFLREKTRDIVRRTMAIDKHLKSTKTNEPLVTLTHRDNGASEVFIYMPGHNNVFAVITAALEQLELSVQDARIYETKDGYTLDCFYVLQDNNKTLEKNSERDQHIIQTLIEELKSPEEFADIVKKRTPRQLKYFSQPTQTSLSFDPIRECSVLEVISPDRPGLLARIARVFVENDVDLVGAKIATLGELVEDIFFITNRQGKAIKDENLIQKIQTDICETLDSQNTEKSITIHEF